VKLANYVSGQWREGSGNGEALVDPVTGEQLCEISSEGIDAAAALTYARTSGSPNLRRMSYADRAEKLGKIAEILAAHRAEYFRISLLNSGATEADASFDVDGAIYTIKQYANTGLTLAAGKMLREGAVVPLSRTKVFSGQHFLTPTRGVAVFINAFNFPAWGFCEKAAPALLSGVPVLVKPASPTAWLTQRMVEDIVKADVLPPGALSILCGPARDLLNHVREEDIISFTGSGSTATRIRGHENVLRRSVRVNIEADSINSAILGPDATPGTEVFDLLVKEVAREMTLKAGQKCTAIRRVFAPRRHWKAAGEAIATRLTTAKVGNPRNPEVTVGPVVNKTQQEDCLAGLAKLKQECQVLFGGDEGFEPIGADPRKAAFVQPTLLACENGRDTRYVHDVEVFGPAATIVPYDSAEDLTEMLRRGLGSLVGSLFTNDENLAQSIILGIGDLHGRILVVNGAVGSQHTGHGNVMPNCLHGGPGRAGGGEELAGLRALLLYHRRFVMQGPADWISDLAGLSADSSLLYN
jgi:3,4-dehydroadipyl-CoA semialdehyde dehydrogenase